MRERSCETSHTPNDIGARRRRVALEKHHWKSRARQWLLFYADRLNNGPLSALDARTHTDAFALFVLTGIDIIEGSYYGGRVSKAVLRRATHGWTKARKTRAVEALVAAGAWEAREGDSYANTTWAQSGNEVLP